MKRSLFVIAFALAARAQAPQTETSTNTNMAWQLCSMQAVSAQTGHHDAVMDALKQD
ncbi:hypothetical protein [Paraburkholderia pallida]|uniref:hypothetical protein n=1 Tax=Paraburkholderia pallida TaxID=2547399 RepID=UPI001431F89D|nr:hypothetical protein [Paraburkholderia pallida]